MKVTHPVFSNGTEGHAWMSSWCSYCVHDHGMHDDSGDGCDVVLWMMVGKDSDMPDPECLVAEPDDGRFFLPSRMICTRFEPCTKDGCSGDPGADERAERVAEVTAYWRTRMAESEDA